MERELYEVMDWAAVEEIVYSESEDPHAILGPHKTDKGILVQAFFPGRESAALVYGKTKVPMEQVDESGFFACLIPGEKEAPRYRFVLTEEDGSELECEDPYRFMPELPEGELRKYKAGESTAAQSFLGAHEKKMGGVSGIRFAVFAPNAMRVSVVGDFNNWDGRRHPMRARGASGVWDIFVPHLVAGDVYKFEIRTQAGERLLKADPFALRAQLRPDTASVVGTLPAVVPSSDARRAANALGAPISIYEVHLGSWRRVPEDGDRWLTYRELADQLVPYAKDLGFTHLELMPVSEHPFDGSWGYQPVGLYAPTSRFGTPEDFRYFIETAHAAGIGVLLDWVPGHFPSDAHGLALFDGTHLYEHADPREGFHQDWNTLIYNYGRKEVRNYLVGNALYWIERFGIDGLRVDAVASMLYRDYSRKDGEWIPNQYGGRENLEAIDFLRRTNQVVCAERGEAIMVAEESTSFPNVSRPLEMDGLGFHYKWNMGWMNDTLRYMQEDPINRRHHHDKMTFGLVYGFTENFVLPLSHDEVVHGKGSLLDRMPGDEWQRFANLRAYYAFMWTHPGKKLLFMGDEIAQWAEWNHDTSLHWDLLDNPLNKGVQLLIGDLNRLYCSEPALHATDSLPEGFAWAVGDDADRSVYGFLRQTGDGSERLLVLCNMTPVPREDYRVGVPVAGHWREVLNTDAAVFGGGNLGNGGGTSTEEVGSHGQAASLVLTLPPLATVVLKAPA
jgi:1,4-alpha-glucan branching enzyme